MSDEICLQQELDLRQQEMFFNRLTKRYKHLRKWAKRTETFAYRIYDRDIPEIPLAVDLYDLQSDVTRQSDVGLQGGVILQNAATETDRYIVMFFYESRYKQFSDNWLILMQDAIEKVFSIEKSHIILKTRKHEKGGIQYANITEKQQRQLEKNNPPATPNNHAKNATEKIAGIVKENDLLFNVDLTSYIDSGLFLDHRPLRKIVEQMSCGKRVLNLFCYTSSFSVYAAKGGASYIESVDLSNTYLAWAERNMKLNGFSDKSKYAYTRADAISFLEKYASYTGIEKKAVDAQRKFDIIILDPPTFSNSKMASNTLDINRDWENLVSLCIKILSPNGTLFFSTNSRKLVFDETKISGASVKEITPKTIDEDFRGKNPHRVWEIVRKNFF